MSPVAYACVVLIIIVLAWYLTKKEQMVSESAWLEMSRGYNVSNANGYYVPITMLSAAEHAGKTSDVALM